MKKIIIIIASLTLCSCYQDGIKNIESGNPNFEVTLLCKVDWCSVYRFNDAGVRYFVTNGSINWTTMEGKNNHVYHQVNTINK